MTSDQIVKTHKLGPDATLLVKDGQEVKAGDVLAVEGSRRYRRVLISFEDGHEETRVETRSKGSGGGWFQRASETTRRGAIAKRAAREQVSAASSRSSMPTDEETPLSEHLSGSKGFTNHYSASLDLRRLSDVVGTGRSVAKPLFIAQVEATERNVEIDCLELTEEIERDGKAGSELQAFSRLWTYLEHAQYGMGEAVVEVLRRIEERLPEAPTQILLVSRAHYWLSRDEWPVLVKRLQRYLPAPVAVADFANPATAAPLLAALGKTRDEAAKLSAAILSHAASHDIEDMDVWEADPGTEADKFWPTVVAEWGPPIFHGRLPRDVHELFARGAALLLAGKKKEGLRALKAAHQVGHPTARRWLAAHGVDAATLPPEPPALSFRRPRPGVVSAAQRTSDELQKGYIEEIEAALRKGDDGSMRRLFAKLCETIVTKHYVRPTLSLGMARLAARAGQRDDMLDWLELAMVFFGRPSEARAAAELSPYAEDPELVAILNAPELVAILNPR